MKPVVGFALCACLFLNSCVTYHLTPQSLVQQVADAQPEKKVIVLVAFPLFIPGVVTGNDLRELVVLDKHEQEVTLPVTMHTGIRITKKDGKRSTFYVNTLLLKDSLVMGKKDHFVGANIKPINLNYIQKIEVQK